MEYIVEWARQITAYLIFTSVLTNLIRKQNYLKYIRLVMGIILILLVAKPLFLIFDGDGNYQFHLSRYLLSEDVSDMTFINQVSKVQDEMLLQELVDAISEQIEAMAMSYGFEVRKSEVIFKSGQGQYGIPESIFLELDTKNTEAENFGYDPPDVIRLREYIVNELGVEKKNVIITLY